MEKKLIFAIIAIIGLLYGAWKLIRYTDAPSGTGNPMDLTKGVIAMLIGLYFEFVKLAGFFS